MLTAVDATAPDPERHCATLIDGHVRTDLTSGAHTCDGTAGQSGTVTVNVSMFEQFTELPGGRCAGYGTFTGLDDNNIAYLTGATIESFATGFTKSSTFPNPFSQGTNACGITGDFHAKTTRPRRLPPASR